MAQHVSSLLCILPLLHHFLSSLPMFVSWLFLCIFASWLIAIVTNRPFLTSKPCPSSHILGSFFDTRHCVVLLLGEYKCPCTVLTRVPAHDWHFAILLTWKLHRFCILPAFTTGKVTCMRRLCKRIKPATTRWAERGGPVGRCRNNRHRCVSSHGSRVQESALHECFHMNIAAADLPVKGSSCRDGYPGRHPVYLASCFDKLCHRKQTCRQIDSTAAGLQVEIHQASPTGNADSPKRRAPDSPSTSSLQRNNKDIRRPT